MERKMTQKEKVAMYAKRYRETHVEEIRRRAAISRDKRFFGGNREKALIRDGYRCQMCGMTNEEHKATFKCEISVDHIDHQGRHSKVQNNEMSNLRTLCFRCHGWKDATIHGVYATYQPPTSALVIPKHLVAFVTKPRPYRTQDPYINLCRHVSEPEWTIEGWMWRFKGKPKWYKYK